MCLTVEDAAELIQPGDIMIARSTDIAWSPLFPMLGGVVTELGGLVSHGMISVNMASITRLLGSYQDIIAIHLYILSNYRCCGSKRVRPALHCWSYECHQDFQDR